MSSEEWCLLCEMQKAYCPHGNPELLDDEPHGYVTKRALLADGPTISAEIPSQCPGCGGEIEPGDAITHTEDGWAHADEVEPNTAPRTSTDLFEGF